MSRRNIRTDISFNFLTSPPSPQIIYRPNQPSSADSPASVVSEHEEDDNQEYGEDDYEEEIDGEEENENPVANEYEDSYEYEEEFNEDDAYTDVDDLFMCPVCLARYSLQDSNLKPVMVLCHHTICTSCAGRLKKRGRNTSIIHCPTCRTITTLKSHDEPLPPNFYIIRFLESRERQVTNASRNTPLAFWCTHCKQVAAADCVKHKLEQLPQAIDTLSNTSLYLSSTLNEILSDKLLSSTNKHKETKETNIALINAVQELKEYISGVHTKFSEVTTVKKKYMESIDKMHKQLLALSASAEGIRNESVTEDESASQIRLIKSAKDLQSNITSMLTIEKSLVGSEKLEGDVRRKLMMMKKTDAYKDRLRILIKTLEKTFTKSFEEIVEMNHEMDFMEDGKCGQKSYGKDHSYARGKRALSGSSDSKGKKKKKISEHSDESDCEFYMGRIANKDTK